MLVLETDRMQLRHLVPDDLDDLFALYRDPEIRRGFPDGTLTREQTRQELAWFQNGHPQHPTLGLWATIDKASGRFIGRCGLLPWTLDGRFEVELAYLLGKPWWGRGLASEAGRGIVRHARDVLGLPRLVSLIMPGNQASVRVANAVGMCYEREVVDAWGPSDLYSLPLPGVAR